MHKSQGFGATKTRGETIEYFKFLKGDSVKQNLFEGFDNSWKRIKGAEQIQNAINKCISDFNYQNPETIIPDLVTIYTLISALPENDANTKYWKTKKLSETENLITSCTGLWFEAGAADFIGIPGRKTEYTVQVIVRNNAVITLKKISWLDRSDSTTGISLQNNKLYTFKHKEVIPSQSQ